MQGTAGGRPSVPHTLMLLDKTATATTAATVIGLASDNLCNNDEIADMGLASFAFVLLEDSGFSTTASWACHNNYSTTPPTVPQAYWTFAHQLYAGLRIFRLGETIGREEVGVREKEEDGCPFVLLPKSHSASRGGGRNDGVLSSTVGKGTRPYSLGARSVRRST